MRLATACTGHCAPCLAAHLWPGTAIALSMRWATWTHVTERHCAMRSQPSWLKRPAAKKVSKMVGRKLRGAHRHYRLLSHEAQARGDSHASAKRAAVVTDASHGDVGGDLHAPLCRALHSNDSHYDTLVGLLPGRCTAPFVWEQPHQCIIVVAVSVKGACKSPPTSPWLASVTAAVPFGWSV